MLRKLIACATKANCWVEEESIFPFVTKSNARIFQCLRAIFKISLPDLFHKQYALMVPILCLHSCCFGMYYLIYFTVTPACEILGLFRKLLGNLQVTF